MFVNAARAFALTLLFFAQCLVCEGADCDSFPGDFCGEPNAARGLIFKTDYLFWWSRDSRLPPLVTSSAPGTSRDEAGVIGLPTTNVLFGGKTSDGGPGHGVRFTLEHDLSRESELGLYASFFFLAPNADNGRFQQFSDGTPILSRPFFDPTSLSEQAELVAFPDVVVGQVSVKSRSDLYGFGSGVKFIHSRQGDSTLTGKIGYRFIQLQDSLSVREDLVSTDMGGVIPVDTEFGVQDDFMTISRFQGINLAAEAQTNFESWSFSGAGSLGFGSLYRRLSIAGNTTVMIPGLPEQTQEGGLLAQPTNIGRHRDNVFVVVPEFNVLARRSFGKNLSLGIGYDLLLMPNVWRAAEQVDRTVNSTQIGGNPLIGISRPDVFSKTQLFWAQGISGSLLFQW